ncbi:MAG: hypothetical protein ACYTBV_09215 [Planctomycetota bacterium]|jgi:hypothetical protein
MVVIVEKLLEYFWLDVFFMLYGIAVVFFSFSKKYAFVPESIAGNLPERFANFIANNEDILLEQYWIRLGSFRCSSPKEDVAIFANFYSSPDYLHHAVLAEAESSIEVFHFIEFCSCLYPTGSICTNNMPYPDAIATRPEKVMVKLPLKNLIELYEIHKEFCERAESKLMTFKKQEPEYLEQFVYDSFRKDYEYQVSKKRMKRNKDGSYSFTFLGSVLAVPLQVIYFLHGYLAKFYSPSHNRILKKVDRKLGRIQFLQANYETV